MGASAFLKSVDFRAFEINVKTIAPIQRFYQSGYAIWCGAAHNVILTLLDVLDLNGKHKTVFTTSSATKPMKLAVKLKKAYPGTKWHKPFNANDMTEEEIRNWMSA